MVDRIIPVNIPLEVQTQELLTNLRTAQNAIGNFNEVNERDQRRILQLQRQENQLLRQQQRIQRQSQREYQRTGQIATRSLNLIRSSLVGVTGALGVRELANYADEWTNINNRIRLVTESQGEFEEASERVFRAAQDTRADLSATAQLYQRLSVGTRDLALSQDELFSILTTVNQSLIISGASAQESRAALIQFGQALASGVLAGEEFRSVSEQATALRDVLADELAGGSVAALRELAAAQELTTDRIVAALGRGSEGARRLADDFRDTEVTIGQALTGLNNSFTRTVGALDDITGASAATSTSISLLSQALDDGVTILEDYGDEFGDIIDAAISATPGVNALAAAFRLLNQEQEAAIQNSARGTLVRDANGRVTNSISGQTRTDDRNPEAEAAARQARADFVDADANFRRRFDAINQRNRVSGAEDGRDLRERQAERAQQALDDAAEREQQFRDLITGTNEILTSVANQQINLNEQIAASEEALTERRKAARNDFLQSAQAASASLVQLFGEETNAGRAAFAIEKGLAVGRATLAIGEAIAVASSKANTPFERAAAVAQAISIGAQALSTIRSATPSSGGSVSGGVSGSGGGFIPNSGSPTGISQDGNGGGNVTVNLIGATGREQVTQSFRDRQFIVDVVLDNNERGGSLSRQRERLDGSRRVGT